MADSQRPDAIVKMATEMGAKKAVLPVSHMLLKGAISGALLGIATVLSICVSTQPFGRELPALGAFVFPVGFCMLVILGMELVTGNMALIPMAVYARQATLRDMWKSWFFVALGNLGGSLLFASMYCAVTSSSTALGYMTKAIAVAKTHAYMNEGPRGILVAMLKAVLCNWMVTTGTVLAFASTSLVGRVVAMWMPIMTFFALGYEHCVVNFFVIPAGMMFGAPVSVLEWWFWNEVPVLIGNVVGGCFLTGLPLAILLGQPRGGALLPGGGAGGGGEVEVAEMGA
mmetsp:Transcript_78963/g.223467  ORF Transcript_78963/g.223467 Transcript_78963/m.223467 type:complete len:285 (+) Transcript_78963:98-952(+)